MKKIILAALITLMPQAASADLTNLNSWIYDSNGNPIDLGQTTMSSGLPVSLASNQTGINSFLDKNGTGTISALNGAVTFTTNGMSTAAISAQGTFTATLQVQCQAGDSAWTSVIGYVPGVGNTSTVLTGASMLIFPIGGCNQVRIIAIAYTSGTANIQYNLGSGTQGSQVYNLIPASFQSMVVGNVAAGTADSGNGVKVSSVANTNNTTLGAVTNGQRADLQSDLNGRVFVNSTPVDGVKTTYAASATITPATTPTDVFTIIGSSTKTIRVTSISVTATATAAATIIVLLVKRSSADTGGTSTAPTIVPYDSNNAAATAVVAAYTANPTLGTSVGNVRAIKLTAAASGTVGQDILLDWGVRPSQAIVLRGAAQQLAINLNSTSITGGSVTLSYEWTEE